MPEVREFEACSDGLAVGVGRVVVWGSVVVVEWWGLGGGWVYDRRDGRQDGTSLVCWCGWGRGTMWGR